MDPIDSEGAGTPRARPAERVASDEWIGIFYGGREIGRLFLYAPRSGKRRELGLLAGATWIADDFDAPLPEDVLVDFEGRD